MSDSKKDSQSQSDSPPGRPGGPRGIVEPASEGGAGEAREAATEVAIRLSYRYTVANESGGRPEDCHETIGLLLEGRRPLAELDAQICQALAALGAAPFEGRAESRWRGFGQGGKEAAMEAWIDHPAPSLWCMPTQQAAMEAIAQRAGEAARLCAEASGAVGWGRALGQIGASSDAEGLGMLFDGLRAKHEALLLRREIGAAPSRAARPGI